MRAALERRGIALERGRYGATWTTDATRRAEDLARGRSWLEDARPTDRRHLRHRGRQLRRGRRHPPWEATPPASPTSPSRSAPSSWATSVRPAVSFDREGFIVRGRGKNALRRVGAAPCVAA